MNILVCAQAVDRNDLYLGFFLRWLEELSERFEKVTVLTLREGSHALPSNVRVVPLGSSRALRAWRLLALSFYLRRRYEAVFVHQGQEFVLVAGWLWRLMGKRVYLWRNHYAGSLLTRVAAALCDKIFYTSKFSYTADLPRAVRMPVGVDTALYRSLGAPRPPRSVLFYGRIAPSKRPDAFLEALSLLKKAGIEFSATLAGSPLPKDAQYAEGLRHQAHALGLDASVKFVPGRPYEEGPRLMSAHRIYANLGLSGMYDKILFEAAACGCAVVAASEDWREEAGEEYWFDGTPRMLAAKLEALLERPQHGLEALAARHSLRSVGERLAHEMRAGW